MFQCCEWNTNAQARPGAWDAEKVAVLMLPEVQSEINKQKTKGWLIYVGNCYGLILVCFEFPPYTSLYPESFVDDCRPLFGFRILKICQAMDDRMGPNTSFGLR